MQPIGGDNVKQRRPYDCGPACVNQVLRCLGMKSDMRSYHGISMVKKNGKPAGCLMSQLAEGLRNAGLLDAKYVSKGAELDRLPMYSIIHMYGNHFCTLMRVTDKFVYFHDPARGEVVWKSREFFMKAWTQGLAVIPG